MGRFEVKYTKEDMLDITNHYYDKDYDYITNKYHISVNSIRGLVHNFAKRNDFIKEIRDSKIKYKKYTKEDRIDITNHYYDGDHIYNNEKYNIDNITCGKFIPYWAEKFDYIKKIKDERGKTINRYSREDMIDITNHYYDKDYIYIKNKYGVNEKTCSVNIPYWAEKFDYIKKIKDKRGRVSKFKYSIHDKMDFVEHFVIGDYDYITNNYRIKSINSMKTNIRKWSKEHESIAFIVNKYKKPKIYKKKDSRPVKYTNADLYPLRSVEEESEESRAWK